MMQTLLRHPIIPVLSVDDSELAISATAALQAGGIHCVEVALRTSNALKVLEAVATAFPEMEVGAGSLRTPEDFNRVVAAGAKFAVSPGSTKEMLVESKCWDIPYLPAAATVSEILAIHQQGVTVAKIFPAGSLGGVKFIQDISAPLPGARFVPSGGVNLDNLAAFLALESVVAVSGSWMLKPDLLASGDFAEVTRLTELSVTLVSG